MRLGDVVFGAIGVGLLLALVVANVVTLVRLWRSACYDRPAKLAQTALVWLVPLSCVLVDYFLREHERREPPTQPTGGSSSYDAAGGDGYVGQ